MVPIRRLVFLLCGATLAMGCTAPDTAGQDAAHSETAYNFADVNPDDPLEGDDRAKLLQAFAELASLGLEGDGDEQRGLATETLARITAGDVLLGSTAAARGIDRWHMCADFGLSACDGSWPSDDDWLGDDEVALTVETELDGYQWGNRLYFTFGPELQAAELASTLVHEVNHVLNRSECHYYTDMEAHLIDDTPAFVEEYRAFTTECLYTGHADDAAGCNAYALEWVAGYGFSEDLTTVLPDGSDDPLLLAELILSEQLGFLFPLPERWPAGFGPCD
ncbi:MAG: hypothetical protein JRI68_19825 [Deltaproteobacteria bacterium]|nr:hypothetical protein [Deltaproteobacteria bacterium]